MDYSKQDLIRNELNRNEQVLWSDEPLPSFFYGGTIVLSIFGLFFFGFALFWCLSALSMGNDTLMPQPAIAKIFPFFSTPFMLVGLGLILAPLWNYRSMRNTCYAITNERCILISGFRSLKTRSYPLNTIHNIEKRQRVNGYGDLIFSKEYSTHYRDGRRRTSVDLIGFKNIPNVSGVNRILRDAMEQGHTYQNNNPNSTELM